MQANPPVTIIIPNYNGREYLTGCLASIKRQSYKNYEIIVVDNGSTDGSIEYIKSCHEDVRIIGNKKNLGYARAVNQAARASKNDYLLIVNNDTEADEKWLEELVRFYNASPDCGSCQSKVLLFEEKNLVNTIGNEIFYLGSGWSGGYRRPENEINDVKEVTYCSGASMLVKRETFFRAGGLDDEEVDMYHDDLDFGWRLLILGYKNYLVPKSVIYHKYRYNKNNSKYYNLEVSRYVCILKYYNMKTILLLFPMLVVYDIGIVGFSIKNGWLKDKMRVYLYIARNMGRLLEKRRKIQGTRKITDREASGYFVGKIDFREINSTLTDLFNPIFEGYWKLVRAIL